MYQINNLIFHTLSFKEAHKAYINYQKLKDSNLFVSGFVYIESSKSNIGIKPIYYTKIESEIWNPEVLQLTDHEDPDKPLFTAKLLLSQIKDMYKYSLSQEKSDNNFASLSLGITNCDPALIRENS
jgi:hypothetical protein